MSESILNIIKNSTTIYNSSIWRTLFTSNLLPKNKLGRYWLGTSSLVQSNADPRARMGKFTSPWLNVKAHRYCQIPQLKFINDSYSDLLDARAIEINNLAKKLKKKIIILWSGGIDSTCLLVAFLKNLNKQDLKNIRIGMNMLSIQENQTFFLNHILNKFDIIEFSNILVSNSLLKNNMLLHGDPGDGINYPGTWHYDHIVAQGKHLNKFTDHLEEMAIGAYPDKKILNMPNKRILKFWYKTIDDGFGLWYVNKIKDNILDCKVDDYITTVADFWWWHYFNIKWNHYTQCALFNMKEDFSEELNPEEIKNYFEYTFYNSDPFQNWAWTNLKKLVREDAHKTLKLEARQYIFDYDKDQNYFDTKRKMPSPSMTNVRARMPYYIFDQNYVGHDSTDNNIHYAKMFKILLEKYDERD
jgi:hypothetical protein